MSRAAVAILFALLCITQWSVDSSASIGSENSLHNSFAINDATVASDPETILSVINTTDNTSSVFPEISSSQLPPAASDDQPMPPAWKTMEAPTLFSKGDGLCGTGARYKQFLQKHFCYAHVEHRNQNRASALPLLQKGSTEEQIARALCGELYVVGESGPPKAMSVLSVHSNEELSFVSNLTSSRGFERVFLGLVDSPTAEWNDGSSTAYIKSSSTFATLSRFYNSWNRRSTPACFAFNIRKQDIDIWDCEDKMQADVALICKTELKDGNSARRVMSVLRQVEEGAVVVDKSQKLTPKEGSLPCEVKAENRTTDDGFDFFIPVMLNAFPKEDSKNPDRITYIRDSVNDFYHQVQQVVSDVSEHLPFDDTDVENEDDWEEESLTMGAAGATRNPVIAMALIYLAQN